MLASIHEAASHEGLPQLPRWITTCNQRRIWCLAAFWNLSAAIRFLFFGSSYKASDFLVDGLVLWWKKRQHGLSHIKHLVINMDNGPEGNGHRSQFLHRMTEFADLTGLVVTLAYYPPYHSKYNSIELFWSGLEKSWNGYLLDSVTTVLCRAATFAWKGIQPVVTLVETVYEKGIKLSKQDRKALESRLVRSTELPWWNITIHPKMVLL
jgi:hypothetical protein